MDSKVSIQSEVGLCCYVHPKELVIAFCETCQKAICFDCSRLEHRDHKCFKMENKAIEARKEVPKLCLQIQGKKLPELMKMMDKIGTSKKEILKTDQVVEKIHKRANELIAVVMEERDALIEACEKSSQAQMDYFHIEENVVKRFVDLYNVSLMEAEDVMKSKNLIELVMFESKLKNQIRDFKPHSLRSPSLPKFKAPSKIGRTLIKDMIGSLICDDSFADAQCCPSELGGLNTKLVSSIRCSCRNVSSISFQDGELAWINHAESTVGSVVDIKGTEMKRFDFNAELSDLTVTPTGVLLATETLKKRILRITNNGIIKEILSTAPLQPHGIHACKNGDLLITMMYKADPKSSDSKRLIQRLDKTYSVKLTIQFEGSFFNKKRVLNHPRRVTENQNGDIVVIDLVSESSGKVYAFDFVGKVRFTYEGSPSRSKFLPFDICCDSELRIFVSDYLGHEINVLNCDGQFIQEIPTNIEGLLNPIAVAFDLKGKLWIGGKGGKIIVYSFC